MSAFQQIPLLHETQFAGIGKMGRKFNARPTNGTETGRAFADIELVHELTTVEEAELLEEAIPGAPKAYRASVGEGSDGKRPYEWKPKHPDYRLLLRNSEDKVLYEGAVEVSRAVLRNTERSCVLTVYVRLVDLKPGHADPCIAAFNQQVSYVLTSASLEGGDSEEKGPLFGQTQPQGRQEGNEPTIPDDEPEPSPGEEIMSCKAGDLITAEVEGIGEGGRDILEDICGIVVSVSGGRVLVHQGLAGDGPRDVSARSIRSVTPICGPRGGPARTQIKEFCERAEGENLQPDAIWLLRAILECAQEGLAQRTEGWPLTEEVITKALDIASEADLAEVGEPA